MDRERRRCAEGRRNAWLKEELDEVFIVKVKTRDHATWQGRLEWTNRRRIRHFRSELELLNLLREALEERQCE